MTKQSANHNDADLLHHLAPGVQLNETGVSRMRQIEKWGKAHGLNKQQTAGILGNMEQETHGMVTTRYGKNWLQESKSIYTGDDFNKYMNQFVKEQKTSNFERFKATTKNAGPKEAAAAWNSIMEGGSDVADREIYARQYENQMNKDDPAHLFDGKSQTKSTGQSIHSFSVDSAKLGTKNGQPYVKLQAREHGKVKSINVSTNNFNQILKANGQKTFSQNQYRQFAQGELPLAVKGDNLTFSSQLTKQGHLKDVTATKNKSVKQLQSKSSHKAKPKRTKGKSRRISQPNDKTESFESLLTNGNLSASAKAGNEASTASNQGAFQPKKGKAPIPGQKSTHRVKAKAPTPGKKISWAKALAKARAKATVKTHSRAAAHKPKRHAKVTSHGLSK